MKKIFILFFFFSLTLTSNGQNVINLIPFVKYDKRALSHKKEVLDTVKISCDLDNRKFIVKSNSLDIEYNYERIKQDFDVSNDYPIYRLYVNNKVKISVSPESIRFVDQNNHYSYVFALSYHDENAEMIDYVKREAINKPISVKALYNIILNSYLK